MDTKKAKKKIAIIGGGPSGLFMYKRLTEAKATNFEIDIFERKDYLGAGPYIGGYSPDYSGIDFCEAASGAVLSNIFS